MDNKNKVDDYVAVDIDVLLSCITFLIKEYFSVCDCDMELWRKQVDEKGRKVLKQKESTDNPDLQSICTTFSLACGVLLLDEKDIASAPEDLHLLRQYIDVDSLWEIVEGMFRKVV